jgi:hypothetical protein
MNPFKISTLSSYPLQQTESLKKNHLEYLQNNNLKLEKKRKNKSILVEYLKKKNQKENVDNLNLKFFLECLKMKNFKRFGFSIPPTVFIEKKKPSLYFQFKSDSNMIRCMNLKAKNLSFRDIFVKIFKNKNSSLNYKVENS